MFRNYLAAAIGNLTRNKLQGLLNLLGLTLGFATAILIGLYIQDELSFNKFLPHYEQTYRLQVGGYGADGKPGTIRGTPHELGAMAAAAIPEIEAITRESWFTPAFRHGAGLLALAVATVSSLYHALQAARSRPILALRYE